MKNLGVFEKVSQALTESGKFDAILVAAPDNVQYLGGALLPFAAYRVDQPALLLWQKYDRPIYIAPAEWESTIRETTWVDKVVSYPATANSAAWLVKIIAELLDPDTQKIGLDLDRFPSALFSQLKSALTGVTWSACDTWLKELRVVKTAEELALLEKIAAKTDHGINGAIHHVTVDRRTTSLTLAEELRVHTEERRLDLIGYQAAAHVVAGNDAALFWANPPLFGYSRTEDLHAGEMVRMKIRTSLNGYWADATRIMTMGEPTPEQSTVYGWLMQVRDIALDAIRPGTTCAEVVTTVHTFVLKNNIPLITDLELGHGVGASPVEPPYLNASDTTILKEGMIIVLEPIVKSPDGQIWINKDTVIITDQGAQVIGWYKDWREPYIPIASI